MLHSCAITCHLLVPISIYAWDRGAFPSSLSSNTMRVLFRSGFGASAAIASMSLVVMSACGGDAAKAKVDPVAKAASCRRGDTTALYAAYAEYIKVTTPAGLRFLTAAGTDSAAPEDAFRAMQDKGPSYYYGGDSAAKLKIREKLELVGPFASLLIVHRGATPNAAGDSVTVRLGGYYIGGELEGKVAKGKTIVVVCADSAWKVSSTKDEPAT